MVLAAFRSSLIALVTLIFPIVVNAQQVGYNRIDLDTEWKRIDGDSIKSYAITRIDTDVYFTYLVKPVWEKYIGLISSDEFVPILDDSLIYSNLIRSSFYQNSADSCELLILSTFGYEDGDTDTKLFSYKNQELNFLGAFTIYKLHTYDPVMGEEEITPRQMALYKENEVVTLKFGEGKYVEYRDGEKEFFEGPFELKISNLQYFLSFN